MPKQVLQDVMPSNKKSIRRVPLSTVRRPLQEERDIEDIPNPIKRPRIPRDGMFKKIKNLDFSKYGIWLLVLIAIVILVFGVSVVLTGATVDVTPKQQIARIDVQGLARKNAEAGSISYDVATVGDSQTVYIPSTGQTHVEKKAVGTIIVYNNYSATPQRLVKNTRFETPQGLIYRIDHSLTVPGKTVVNKATVPGSVEATVTADMAGTNYNLGLTDFTIPGFKGDPRYTGFYARSKTPMTGGFEGTAPTASADKLNAAYASIEANLKKILSAQLKTQAPATYILFDSAMTTSFDRPQPVAASGNMVAITERATTTALMFRRADIATYLAEKTIADYEKSPIMIANTDTLTFSPVIPANFQPGDPIQFGMQGSALFVWTFDEVALQKDLAGKSKRDVSEVLTHYPGVEKMEAVIRPFWRSSFPSDPKKISIVKKVTYPAADTTGQ